jgi:hypothetical protein
LRSFLSLVYRRLNLFEELLNSLSAALLLLAAMYCWMNFPMNFIGEETFAKVTVKIGDLFEPRKSLPYDISDVMFIDVSRSNAIVIDNYGTHVIADRAKLDTLFQLLHRNINPDQIIVCDLYFDISSAQDSSLQASMEGFPNLLSTVKTNWHGDITPNVLKAGTSATTGFQRIRSPFLIFSNSLYKFHLTDEKNIKTLPLLMYERVNNTSTSCWGNALKINNDWYFNTVQINEQLGRTVTKAVYEDQVIPIQQVISAAKQNQNDEVAQLRYKKFIVIGDFEEDVHQTTFGQKPGPMIIFDVFLSLQQKENMISAGWLLLAVGFLTLLFFRRFYRPYFFRGYATLLTERFAIPAFKLPVEFDLLLFYLFVLCSAIFFRVYMEAIAGLLFLSIFIRARGYLKNRFMDILKFHRSGGILSARILISLLFRKQGFRK